MSWIRLWWGDRPIAQIGLLLCVAAVFGILGSNTVDSLDQLGIAVGFEYLERPANFEIGDTLLAYTPADSYGRAVLIGVMNTLSVSVIATAAATLAGVLIASARLSGNRLLAGLAQVYVEAIRNTPLLLQLFLCSTVIHALPPARSALEPLPGVFLSNRGIAFPVPQAETPALLLVALALVCLTPLLHRRAAGGRAMATLAICLAAAAAALGTNLDFPRLTGFNHTGGGSLSPEFLALTLGLTINAAAGIAEIVRGGILAVPRGQWEAARSIGLDTGKALRLVILPQAMRVIVPLMTSSYLSLVKNSSLAVAIGFPDLVSIVNTTANQTGQVIESLLVMVCVYLAINLTVSALMNRYNRILAARQ